MQQQKWGFIACLALVVLSACPGAQPKQPPQNQGLTVSAGQNVPVNAAGQTAAEPVPAQSPESEGNSIAPVEETVQFNQPFKVEFTLAVPSTGDAFIALVPGAVTSTLLKDNVRQAVDRVTMPPGSSGQVELTAHHTGTYFVRLFTAQTGEIMSVAEATVTVTDQPAEGTLVLIPPYVTITFHELPEVPEQYRGRPVIAYWELSETPGPDAWIGLVPTSCVAHDAAANLDAAVDVQYLDRETMDRNVFHLDELGEFVFRIFAAKDAPQMLCESQVFRSIEPPPPPEPGE